MADARFSKGRCVLEIRVRPDAPRFLLREKEGMLVAEVPGPAREGRANAELLKGLRKLFGARAEIVKGARSREKVVAIELDIGSVRRILEGVRDGV